MIKAIYTRPLYIFDLDGTLALTEHRQRILDDQDNPNRWDDFFDACDKDEPNFPVIKAFLHLQFVADVLIWSGRSAKVRQKTVDWIADNAIMSALDVEPILKMRPEGDYTPDEKLKEQWLDELSAHDRRRLVAVFDDRDKVVDMWRAKKVACFQVAPGRF